MPNQISTNKCFIKANPTHTHTYTRIKIVLNEWVRLTLMSLPAFPSFLSTASFIRGFFSLLSIRRCFSSSAVARWYVFALRRLLLLLLTGFFFIVEKREWIRHIERSLCLIFQARARSRKSLLIHWATDRSFLPLSFVFVCLVFFFRWVVSKAEQ